MKLAASPSPRAPASRPATRDPAHQPLPPRLRRALAGPLRLLAILAVVLAGSAGCATQRWTVKPHQRELLADRIMQPDGDAQEAAADDHVLSNREGAIGGSGTSGGGCGCN